MHKKHGFTGMLGSLDCMHWRWKNCPAAWAGQYTGKEGNPTIILEAVVSYDLWFWHAFFGMPGSHNDINVLDSSHLFSDLENGRAPPANFTINGNEYDMGYYLADGMYSIKFYFIISMCPHLTCVKFCGHGQGILFLFIWLNYTGIYP